MEGSRKPLRRIHSMIEHAVPQFLWDVQDIPDPGGNRVKALIITEITTIDTTFDEGKTARTTFQVQKWIFPFEMGAAMKCGQKLSSSIITPDNGQPSGGNAQTMEEFMKDLQQQG